jgi:hypothetical protein
MSKLTSNGFISQSWKLSELRAQVEFQKFYAFGEDIDIAFEAFTNEPVGFLDAANPNPAAPVYFDIDDNFIINYVKWELRGPDYVKSWLRYAAFAGMVRSDTAVDLLPIPVLGGVNDLVSGGAPPSEIPLNYFVNSDQRTAAMAHQTIEVNGSFQIKLTKTDMKVFVSETIEEDEFSHQLYFSMMFNCSHTLPLV